jgi:hypothetical protein
MLSGPAGESPTEIPGFALSVVVVLFVVSVTEVAVTVTVQAGVKAGGAS